MELINQDNAADYLRATARVSPDERIVVRELTGGVSNMVLLIQRPDRTDHDFVIKQARAQLRTPQAWYSRVERIWREADVLRVCERYLATSPAPGRQLAYYTPRILFEDREKFLFAMSAAPGDSCVWKQDLLTGQLNEQVAVAAGRLLSKLHAGSWQDFSCAELLGDRSLFDELRVDPYYRTLAMKRPDCRPFIEPLITSLSENVRCLVHADFSPKNMLISPKALVLVDFETGHFGDPAFDLGFFLSHLVLKACYSGAEHDRYLALSRRFEQTYSEGLTDAIGSDELARIWSRGVRHFAACAWARLDGKSPVEYLSQEASRETMRRLCRQLLTEGPADWSSVVTLASERFKRELPC